MNLTPYVDTFRRELAVAAEAGGSGARELAERLSAPLESAARLTLLDALTAAADEITRELAPGSVDVRLRGLDPEFVVVLPYEDRAEAPVDVPAPASPAVPVVPAGGDEGGTARINLRLPAHLKALAEEAAGRAGMSVNSWLVQAVSAAVGAAQQPRPRTTDRSRPMGQRHEGWVR